MAIVTCAACGQKNRVSDRPGPRCGKCGLPLRECDVRAAREKPATLFDDIFSGFSSNPFGRKKE